MDDMSENAKSEQYQEKTGRESNPIGVAAVILLLCICFLIDARVGFGALIGAALAWWTGLPPLAQTLLIVQGADILTGLLCAVTGKSRKTESGKVSSSALLMGVLKKGLEWLVVGVCVSVGNGLGVTSVCGAAMTYMIATELVSLIENLEIFGLNVPLLGKLLDVAQGDGEEGRAQGRQ